jgi:serine/threonine protein kinase
LLIHELGRGSFGVVWEVEDLQAKGDRKAIKICTKQDFASIEQFRQEYYNLDELNCDRIVKVENFYPQRKLTEYNFDESFHFFVMEKVEGKILENLVKESLAKSNNHHLNFWSSAWQFLFYRYPPLRSQISYLQLANWIEQLAEAFRFRRQRVLSHLII